MLNLDILLAQLGDRPEPSRIVGGFVPPPRFSAKAFRGYLPRTPSQGAAATRMKEVAVEIANRGKVRRLLRGLSRDAGRRGRGIYLDGSFGVGKTHLLAALWDVAPAPKTYAAFDELMHFIGLVGPAEAAAALRGSRLVAIDEWELDDPGNLKMAQAFLRPVLRAGTYVAVTSNTLPLDLGSGRFSQKDFRAEMEELAASFEVVRVEGEDFRHRQFLASPGQELYLDPSLIGDAAASRSGEPLRVPFTTLIAALATVHPIRYREMARRLDGLVLEGIEWLPSLPDALRWVHFVDSVYDAGVWMLATGSTPLPDIFSADALAGPYGKKLARCLSRMEELLGEGRSG